MLTIIARNLGHNQLAAGAKQGSSQLICMISSLQVSSSVHAFTQIRQFQNLQGTFNFPAHFLKVIDIGLGNLTTVHLTTYTLGGKHAGTRWLS